MVGNLFSVYDVLLVYGTGSHPIESFVNRDVLESYDLARACFREAVRLYPYSSQNLNDTAFAFYCKTRTLRFQSVPTKHRYDAMFDQDLTPRTGSPLGVFAPSL